MAFTITDWIRLSEEFGALPESDSPTSESDNIIGAIQDGLRPISDLVLIQMSIDALMLVYERNPNLAIDAIMTIRSSVANHVMAIALAGGKLPCGHTTAEHASMPGPESN